MKTKSYVKSGADNGCAEPKLDNSGSNLRIAARLCSIVLCALFVAASVNAQTPTTATENELAPQVENITPPPVPTNIQPPANTKAFLVGHAIGSQNYVCAPSGGVVMWTLFTPQATLFDDEMQQITTHFFSPNPFEAGTVRPTWQHSRDTSAVWGKGIQTSSDPNFVMPGAIPWLLIQVKDVGAQTGPTGGDKLTKTTYIQRLNTIGGSAPSNGCSSPTDVGAKVFVPYTADYYFYKNTGNR